MANSNPWQLRLDGRVLANKSTRVAACNAGDREARGFVARHAASALEVRHKRTGETWRRVRGSWMRVDAKAPPVPGRAA